MMLLSYNIIGKTSLLLVLLTYSYWLPVIMNLFSSRHFMNFAMIKRSKIWTWSMLYSGPWEQMALMGYLLGKCEWILCAGKSTLEAWWWGKLAGVGLSATYQHLSCFLHSLFSVVSKMKSIDSFSLGHMPTEIGSDMGALLKLVQAYLILGLLLERGWDPTFSLLGLLRG